MDIKKIALEEDRFKSHTFLDDPIPFSELFKGQYFDLVDVYSIFSEMGSCFCGTFRWMNNDIQSLDGDTYNKDMLVYAYEKFINESNGFSSLSILVGTDW